MTTRTLICFDVNETLLDFTALDPLFAPYGGDAARRAWFSQIITSAMSLTLAGHYMDFSQLGRQALTTVATRRGWTLPDNFGASLAAGLAQLPAHGDALAALQQLRRHGYRLAALTNSAPAAVTAQLEQAGLASQFDAILSVDAVRRFKPAPEVYRMAAAHFGVDSSAMWLVAAHDWDVMGACSAGCSGAFIARDGERYPETWPPATLTAPSLAAAAQAIAGADGRR